MDGLTQGDPVQVGPYKLLGRLGAGGMGQVYLGESPGGRRLAVKVIRAAHTADLGFRARFGREIEAARRVNGFYTAPVVDADPSADPAWMATAYVPGPSLRHLVAGAGPLPAEQVRTLGAGLAEGLAAIHAAGLVHRDLKPGNVIVAEDGPRIIDFGIARALDASTMTATGTLIGTLAYMSPEQVDLGEIGPPSDVFSLGSVLTFAATGRGPFDAPSPGAIVHGIKSLDPGLDGVPSGLREIVARCLAKKPGERPVPAQLVSEFAAASLLGRAEFARAPGLAAPGPPESAGAAGLVTPGRPEAAGAAGLVALGRPGVVGAPPFATPAAPRRPSRRAVLAAGVGGVLATAAAVGVAVRLLGEMGEDEPGVAYGRPFTSEATIVHEMVFTPDGRTIFAAKGLTDEILVFDVATGRLLRSFRTGYKITIGGLALAPDGTTLAASGTGQPENVTLWDARTGRRLNAFQGAGGPPVFSPDGRILAADLRSPTADEEIQLWDMVSRSRITTIKGGEVRAFSPDGRLLAGVAKGNVVLWDTASRRVVTTFKESETDTLAFSPDGRMMALGDYGKVIKLRDTATGALIAELPLSREISPNHDGIRSMAFSRDGRYLASNGAEKTLLVWDVPGRRLAAPLTGHTIDVNVVAFSPDGRTLASGGGDSVRLWDITKLPRT